MTTTYTWTITALNCSTQVEDKPDYVLTAHWTCSGTDGAYFASGYNTTSFEIDPSKQDYIPFDELTEADVIGWVQSAMGEEGVAATENAIATQIETQKNPPIVTPQLPWIVPSDPA